MKYQLAFPLGKHPWIGLLVNVVLGAAALYLLRAFPPIALWIVGGGFAVGVIVWSILCMHNPVSTLDIDEDGLRYSNSFGQKVVAFDQIADVHVRKDYDADNWLVMDILARDGKLITLDARFIHHNNFEVARLLADQLAPKHIQLRMSESVRRRLA